MTELSVKEFIAQMVKDGKRNVVNFTPKKVFTLPLPADSKLVREFTKGLAYKVVIFDGQEEHPYMINLRKRGNVHGNRNEEIFKKGVELRLYVDKSMREIAKEVGIGSLKEKRCQICEGGGWFSDGWRYSYGDYYTEV